MKKVLSLLYTLAMIFLVYLIFKIDILPNNILIIILFGILFITIILNLILLKSKNRIINSIVLIIMLITGGIILYGANYLNNTVSFIKEANSIKEEINKYYVVVLDKSEYKEIDDINNKKVGYIENTPEEVFNKIDVELDYNSYSNQLELYKDLDIKKIEAILVSDSYMDIMTEEVDNFKENTRVLYTIDIHKKIEGINKSVETNKESFTIYISGIDTYGSIGNVSRSDVNILVTVNPNTGKILLTSIPRDYYVILHGTTGYKDKLTHAGLYGINMSVSTIEDLIDIDINYYVRVNFNTLIKVIDEIGGIDIYSDTDFIAWTDESCKFSQGMNSVGGKCALAFSRERYAYQSGDRHRGQNQQAVISAIIKKVNTDRNLILKYNDILDSLSGTFQTNMQFEDITSFIKNQINNNISWDIESISLDGYDSSNYTYSYSGSKLYVMEPNYNTVENAKNKILEVSS